MPPPSRRELFHAAPLAALPFLVGRAAGQAPPSAAEAPADALITRMQQPRNVETPVSRLVPPAEQVGRKLLTSTDSFFIRSHFALPTIDLKTWRLRIEGHVETPVEYSLDDLQKLPQVKKALTLECAGNGRVFLAPQARGLQWAFGGVGTAEWGGLTLASLLENAKPKAGATDVVLVGSDRGAITSDPPSPGIISFDRGIPLEKAYKPETILAMHMNGQPLSPSHGFPLRAVIGGWYGMASVKWLTRIIVVNRPHTGFWQTLDYSHFERRDELASLVPVTRMEPKAIITSHTTGQIVRAGKPIALRGLAWSGESPAAKVEVSTDDGKTWAAINLEGAGDPFVWREWNYTWAEPKVGPVNLLARCTDAAGRTQPDKRDPDRRTYMINHLVPVELQVK